MAINQGMARVRLGVGAVYANFSVVVEFCSLVKLRP